MSETVSSFDLTLEQLEGYEFKVGFDKAAYPKDTATGFAEGDFRGVFWAEVKPQKP